MAAARTGIGATTSESKVQFVAMQTVIPMEQSDPALSVRVLAAQNHCSSIYKRCFNVVFCYNKDSDEDSGSLVAGWIKESLGSVLSEKPTLAGRLKRKDDSEGELEIVSNDSGVRLIEAEFGLTLQEFLDLQEKREAEAELVFWQGIDHEINPQFSPLFYIQVSSFKCGGYSIGISCSLLLLDPFAMISFLKKWTNIHMKMISQTDMPKIPTFYRPKLRNTGSSGLPIGSRVRAPAGQSVIFNIATRILNLDKEIHKNIAALCVDEAELKCGQKPASKYSLFVKDESSEDVKVQTFTREGFIDQKLSATVINRITPATWNDLGAENICFNEGNKPVYVSSWINSVVDETFVMVIPSPEKDGAGMKIILTYPI